MPQITQPKRRRIAWLPGDPPGEELVEAARQVYQALLPDSAEHETGTFGWSAWLQTGQGVPSSTLDLCLSADAVLIGALARGPEDSDPKRLQARLAALREGHEPDPLTHLRRELELGLMVADCRLYPAQAGG